MNDKKRIYVWDNIKFILILLVVVGHFCEKYLKQSGFMKDSVLFIYTFHMPLFIFISGLFSKKLVNGRTLNKEKIVPYLLLFVFMKTIFYLFRLLIGVEGVRFTLFSENGVPWFVLSLFCWYVITYYIKDYSRSFCLTAAILLGCMVGYDTTLKDSFAVARTIVFYPFFLVGYYCDFKRILKMVSSKQAKIAAVVVLGGFIFLCYFKSKGIYWVMPLLSGRNPYTKLGEMQRFGGLIRFAYYGVVAIISLSIIALVPKRKLWISKLGQRTLPVYVFHYLFIFAFARFNWDDAIMRMFPNRWELIFFAIGVVVTLVTTLSIFEWPLNKIMKIKKQPIILEKQKKLECA